MDGAALIDARVEFRSRSKQRPSDRGVVFPQCLSYCSASAAHSQLIREGGKLVKGFGNCVNDTCDGAGRDDGIDGMHHVNRVEAPRQTVCPAFLAADQCVHDLHAGELGQYHEPCPLDYCISYRSAYWTPGCIFDFHACGETLRASIRQCDGRWRPDNVGRRLLAHESLPYPLCRAHRDGCDFRSLDAGGLISLRRPRATPSGGMGSGFRIACPLTF